MAAVSDLRCNLCLSTVAWGGAAYSVVISLPFCTCLILFDFSAPLGFVLTKNEKKKQHQELCLVARYSELRSLRSMVRSLPVRSLHVPSPVQLVDASGKIIAVRTLGKREGVFAILFAAIILPSGRD